MSDGTRIFALEAILLKDVRIFGRNRAQRDGSHAVVAHVPRSAVDAGMPGGGHLADDVALCVEDLDLDGLLWSGFERVIYEGCSGVMEPVGLTRGKQADVGSG